MPGDEDLDEEQLLAREEAMKAEEALMATFDASRLRWRRYGSARRRTRRSPGAACNTSGSRSCARPRRTSSCATSRSYRKRTIAPATGKDAAIERLARELDTAEEQHRASLRAHTAQLDALDNLQHRLVRHLDDEFRRNLRSLTQEFQNERASIDASHSRRTRRHARAHRRDGAGARGRHRTRAERLRDGARGDQEQERRGLQRLALDAGNVGGGASSSHGRRALEYVDETGSRAESFKELAAKDASAAGTIEKRMRRIDRTQEQLAFSKPRLRRLRRNGKNATRRCAKKRKT
jgi:hypothetical protein